MTDALTEQDDTSPERTWQDEARPLAERVELLLALMTLEEKIGQLGSRWMGNNLAGEPGVEGSDLQVAPMQDVFAASGTVPLVGGEPARPRTPHPHLRQCAGHAGRGSGMTWSSSSESSWGLPGSASPPSCTRSA